MQDIINEFIGGLKLGRKQSYRNLTVFALLSDYTADFDYLTLDEALSGNLIDIVEKDEAGSVPELKVVNKSDREDAGRTYTEILMMLEMSDRKDGRMPPVIRTVATTGGGVEELAQAILDHYEYLKREGFLEKKAKERIVAEVLEIINRQVGRNVMRALQEDPEMIELMEKMVETREIDPHSGARMVIQHLMKKG